MTLKTFLEISNEELDALADAADDNYSVWKTEDNNGEEMYCYIQKIQVPDVVGGNFIVGCRNLDGSITFTSNALTDEPTAKEVEDLFF